MIPLVRPAEPLGIDITAVRTHAMINQSNRAMAGSMRFANHRLTSPALLPTLEFGMKASHQVQKTLSGEISLPQAGQFMMHLLTDPVTPSFLIPVS
jgi:hypothetical protein